MAKKMTKPKTVESSKREVTVDIKTRNELIKAERAAGRTLEEIGNDYGITKARVLQIVGKQTSYRRHITAGSIQYQIADFFAKTGAFPTLRAIADMVDISTSYARMLLDELAKKEQVELTAQRGRIYITGVVPPEGLPEEAKKQVVSRLDGLKKEWSKK